MPTSARVEVSNSLWIFVKTGASCRVDVGIDPYGILRNPHHSIKMNRIDMLEWRKSSPIFSIFSVNLLRRRFFLCTIELSSIH